jgi:hypothetical protein
MYSLGIYSSTFFTINSGAHFCGCKITYAQGLFDKACVAGNKWTMGTIVRNAVNEVFSGQYLMVHDNRPDNHRLGDYTDTTLWDHYGHDTYFTRDELERLGNVIHRRFLQLLG